MGLVNKYLQQHKTQGVTRESRSYTPRQQTRGNLEIGQYLNSCNCQAQEKAMFTAGLVNMGINALFGNIIPGVVALFSGRNKATNTVPVETKQDPQKIQNEVETILKKHNVEYDADILQKVAEKYPNMKEIQTGGLSVEQRVINYAKGLAASQRYENISVGLNNNTADLETILLGAVDTAMKAGSQTDFNNAFLQYAQEQIEIYDTNNDGTISYEEFSAEEKAKANAVDENLYNENATKAVFNTINQNKEDNQNIDKSEMAALIWATAKINDTINGPKTANNITPDEIKTITNALATIGLEADFDNYTPLEQLELIDALHDGTLDKENLLARLNEAYKGFNNYLQEQTSK